MGCGATSSRVFLLVQLDNFPTNMINAKTQIIYHGIDRKRSHVSETEQVQKSYNKGRR